MLSAEETVLLSHRLSGLKGFLPPVRAMEQLLSKAELSNLSWTSLAAATLSASSVPGGIPPLPCCCFPFIPLHPLSFYPIGDGAFLLVGSR